MNLFKDHRVLVCAGTGGVGKTTISASLGMLAAQKGHRVLVLTIDPARRLATALGIEKSDEFVKVPYAAPGELWASMIYPEKVFDEFVRNTAPTPQAAERLLRNRLYQQMATTLSGSQEFTALERVLVALESEQFDLIVLDTPPSQHAVDFLKAPENIFNLFQESITRWFVTSKSPSGMFGKIFSQGTRTALLALQKVTGGKFIGELSDFFESIAALQEKVRERSIKLHKMLGSTQTGFILVTGSDALKLKEAGEFYEGLIQSGHHFLGVIVNRTFPRWRLNEKPASFSADDWKKVESFYQKINSFYSAREQSYDKLKAQMGAETFLLKVPEMKGQMAGLESLVQITECLEKGLQ